MLKKATILLALISVNSFAADGVVRFEGSIVEPPCSFTTTNSSVTSSCPNSDVKAKNTQVFNTYNINSDINYSDGRYSISTQNINKNAKVLIVSYN